MDGLLKLIQMVGIEPFALRHPDSKTDRSPQWPTVRKHHLAENPVCVVSGLKYGEANESFDVHHYAPFHTHPEKELDPKNLRTVIRQYHYLLAHFCNWSDINPHFDDMCSDLHKKIAEHKRNY